MPPMTCQRDRDAHAAHRAQVPEVRPERRAERVLCDVADAVLLRVALHDLGDMGVVRVRDPWEQVVLTGLRGQKSTVVSTSCTAQSRLSAASCSAEVKSASSTQCASWKVTAMIRLTTIE